MTTEPQTGPAAFSPSDAALEGFRLMRRRPGTILAWSAIYFAGLALIGGLMLLTLGPKFIDLARKGQFMLNDPDMLGDALAGSWPAFFLVLLLTVLLSSIMTAGVFRLVMRPEEKGFMHLRLGREEFKLVGANLLLLAMGILFLATGFIATRIALQAGPLAASLGGLVMLGAGLYVGVRLALVTPMTFDLRKIALREGWDLTRGRFWPLFGMTMLAVIFYLIVYLLVMIMAVVLGEVFGGQGALKNFRDATTIALIAGALLFGMQLVLQTLQLVMIYGPFALGLRQLRGEGSATHRSVMSQDAPASGMPSLFAVYDEAFSSWSGVISDRNHWAAVGYWFLSVLVLIVMLAAFSVATLQGMQGAIGAGFALGLMLTLPIYIMLFLSTVKRGRVLGIPGWLTALLAFLLPLTALGYGLAAMRKS